MGCKFEMYDCEFQFALPRGERLEAVSGDLPNASFNSRSRVGSDLISLPL